MIRRFLDVSSGHLTPGTWTWLDTQFGDDSLRDPVNHVAGQLAGGRTRYGWFVYAAENFESGVPDDLARILAEARKRGADYVLFDCDAVPDQRFPVLHPDFANGR